MLLIIDMNQVNGINNSEFKKINLLPFLILSTVIFIVFIGIGFIVPSDISTDMMKELQETIKQLESLSPVALMMVIFLNNAIKCLSVILLGVIIGLPSAMFVCFNAVTIGMLIAALGPALGYNIIAASLLPHGIIEIPVLILCGALGLSIGAEVWKFIIRRSSSVKMHLKFGLIIYGRWLIMALIVAAIIEVFVTPLIMAATGSSAGTLITP